MKHATFIGIGLVILGILSFAYQGMIDTAMEKAIDLGALLVGVFILVLSSNNPLAERP